MSAGAAVVCGALALLADVAGGDAPAARIWALAGVIGAALGPAAGGILTQLFGWESIFLVQAPVVLFALLTLRGARVAPDSGPIERPHIGANAALLLVSGALVAALFLLVILLINGWRLEPLAAGLVVTVMPLAAIVAARWGHAVTPMWARTASGVILIAGGLAALGWLPHAGAAWTVPPQLAIGAGLGLALSALTEQALAGRSAQVVHGGWTIAARHAGVVVGLLLLTPLFTAGLERNEDDALAAGTSAVLDSRIPPLQKLTVARRVLAAVDEAKDEARIPAVDEVVGDRDDPAYDELVSSCRTSWTEPSRTPSRVPFSPPPASPCSPSSRSCSVGGIRPSDARDRSRHGIAVALVGVYLALGGASYAPAAVADPCAPREDRNPEGFEQVVEQIVLSALDGAACELGVSREEVVLAFSSRASLERFAQEHGDSSQELEDLARAGLERALDDAERADQLGPGSRTYCGASPRAFRSPSCSTCSSGCRDHGLHVEPRPPPPPPPPPNPLHHPPPPLTASRARGQAPPATPPARSDALHIDPSARTPRRT